MLDRSTAPISSSIKRPTLPHLESFHLSNGIPVHILNRGDQPIVLLEMVIPVGRFEEPIPGLAYFLFKMLTEGTKQVTSSQIAEEFDQYGSQLEIVPYLDAVSIKLYSLHSFFPAQLHFLINLIQGSIFPEKELEILKTIRKAHIKQQNARNSSFASLKFREVLFGNMHPYGAVLEEEDVASISRELLVDHQDLLLVQPMIFLSGMVTETIFKAVSSELERMAFVKCARSEFFDITTGKSVQLVRDESTQASLRMGRTMIDRHHPDIHKVRITNELFGGFFGSRLMKNIREEKGLTYGIHSSIMHLKHSTYWVIQSELSSENVDLGRVEIFRELVRIQNELPGKEEFDTMINHLKGKFLSSFDSLFSAHEMMKSLIQDNLSTEYYIRFFEILDSMGPEEINETSGKYFQERTLVHLTVI